jgi:hypothetical protein
MNDPWSKDRSKYEAEYLEAQNREQLHRILLRSEEEEENQLISPADRPILRRSLSNEFSAYVPEEKQYQFEPFELVEPDTPPVIPSIPDNFEQVAIDHHNLNLPAVNYQHQHHQDINRALQYKQLNMPRPNRSGRFKRGRNSRPFRSQRFAGRRYRRYGAGGPLNKYRQWVARNQVLGGELEIGSNPSVQYFGQTYDKADQEQRWRRKFASYYGPGDYRKYLSRGIGAAAGGALGYAQGGWAGALSGARAGYGMGRDFSIRRGWGDYDTSGNQLIGGSGPQQQIAVNPMNNTGDIFISHTEFIGNVTATVANGPAQSGFEITQYTLNPGLFSTFPFLSQLSQNYILYEFEGLIFQYKPTSGEFGSANSNSLGKVVMATNYDPDAAPFLSSVQMENYDYANATKPSCGAEHGVETVPQQRASNMLYVRTGATTKDLSFTDLGNFFIATEGIPFGSTGAATAIIGELWVTYKIRLSRANLYGTMLGYNILFCNFLCASPTITHMKGTVQRASNKTIDCYIKDTGTDNELQVVFPDNITQASFSLQAWFLGDGTHYFDPSSALKWNAVTNGLSFIPIIDQPIAGNTDPEGYVLAPYNGDTKSDELTALSSAIWVTVLSTPSNPCTVNLTCSNDIPIDGNLYIWITQVNHNNGVTWLPESGNVP